MSELSELLERLNTATGPDDELEAAVWLAVIPGASRRNVMAEWPTELPIWEYYDPERNTFARFIPAIMSSVDAALSLVDRCGFPLRQWNYTMAAAYGSFSIIPNDGESTGIHDKRCGHAHGAATIPIAILSALLAALIAKETSHDNH